ncbi:4F2 cell-surface antigen heavy chain [Oryzias melastigma]|uniref:4F2 cell-surface antigen heavy chain n=1 Tax=Oryzias melastigma TaxID=30732 RepID=A0A834KZZ6_ORYME|nr:4F2 cell-surface antigen heavy chain [Oryzias melastigma]
MNKDTEIDMEEVKLNEVDPEKQPMTGDGQAAGNEKNGSVKLKVPEDEVTFTGLSKEELLRVAGTPGWVRTRWVLLVLFWLGWVGMLAGAIVIIVQAPRCKPIPEMNWWNEGPLYQIDDLDAFCGGMEGLKEKLDDMTQLKVKGLVLGPFHRVQKDKPATLNLELIDPSFGSLDKLKEVLERAHKKGISVVLDLTPNYMGSAPWFENDDENHGENACGLFQSAAEYWLKLGVDGIKLPDLSRVSNSTEWPKLRAAVQGNRTEDAKIRGLMGVVEGASASEVSQLINASGVDLVLSDLLSSNNGGPERIRAMDVLHSQQRSLGWGLGASSGVRLSSQAKAAGLIRLYQLLLFTMPGTPVFTYGDEIGLQAGNGTKMVWNLESESEANGTEYAEVRKWFKSLSDLRGKERSLLHGDYYSLYSSPSSLAFLRVWDQSERYITAVNWGDKAETLKLSLTPTGKENLHPFLPFLLFLCCNTNNCFVSTEGVELPETAKVKITTDENQEIDSSISLDKITLGPRQALLLQFPYTA